MKSIKLMRAMTVTYLAIGGFALADEEAPMMVKGQSGVALEDHVDSTLCHPDGVALGGYDVVSYWQDGGPVMGSENHSLEHGGATYWFSSGDNQSAFVKDPAKYLPAYSGFCAITLALGRVTCPDYGNFQD